MNKQLIHILGAGLLTSSLIGCGGVDGNSAANQNNANELDSSEVTQLPNNYTLSLNGGTDSICTSLLLENCNDYFAYARNNIYSEIPQTEITEGAPVEYVLTQEAIDSLPTTGEFPNLKTILTGLLNNTDELPEDGVYTCVLNDNCDGSLQQAVRDGSIDADGNYYYYEDFPSGQTATLEGNTLDDALSDADRNTLRDAVAQGVVVVDTFSLDQDKLSTIADSATLNKSILSTTDLVSFLEQSNTSSSLEKSAFIDAIEAVASQQTTEPVDAIYLTQTDVDALDASYADIKTVLTGLLNNAEELPVGGVFPCFLRDNCSGSLQAAIRNGSIDDDGNYYYYEDFPSGQTPALEGYIIDNALSDADRNTISAQFEANQVATIDGETALSLLTDFEVDTMLAIAKDRSSADPREVAAVGDSKEQSLSIYFKNLSRDIKRIGGADATVSVLTFNSDNPYRDAEVYSSIFELEGLNAQWVPVESNLFAARALDNNCATLTDIAAVELDIPGIEVEYADLVSQHVAACKDDSLITTAIANSDAFFVVGGDLATITDLFTDGMNERAWYTAVKNRIGSGDVMVAGEGSSALLFTGDNLLDNTDGVAALGGATVINATSGVEQFSYGIVDTFTGTENDGEGNSIARVVSAMGEASETLGLSIAANSSVRVAPVSATEVKLLIGGQTVFLIDSNDATGNTGLVIHKLSQGDQVIINPQAGTIISADLSDEKNSDNDAGFNESAASFDSSNDAFSEGNVTGLIFGTYLAGFDENPLTLNGPRDGNGDLEATSYEMTFTRKADSNVVDDEAGYESFTNFTLDIVENP